MMKMKCGSGCRVLQCQVSVAKNVDFQTQVRCALEPDTVNYAVCRFLSKSAALSRLYVPESYQLRFGKGRRAGKHWCVIPAMLMDLPGAWVQIHCVVNAQGVTVDKIRLLKSYPGLSKGGYGRADFAKKCKDAPQRSALLEKDPPI